MSEIWTSLTNVHFNYCHGVVNQRKYMQYKLTYLSNCARTNCHQTVYSLGVLYIFSSGTLQQCILQNGILTTQKVFEMAFYILAVHCFETLWRNSFL